MPTLQESIEELDRMIKGPTPQPEIRSQLAFIGREVAALESDYAELSRNHANLQVAHSTLQDEHAKLKSSKSTPPFSPPLDILKTPSPTFSLKRINYLLGGAV